MDKKCLYCTNVSQSFDCNLILECKYEPNFITNKFIEELEKIKAEIEGINKSNDSMYCVGVTNALIILDKHIYELKGEQK